MPEFDRDVQNQIYNEMCTKCSYRYWEACPGTFHTEWGVLACNKVRERYHELVAEKEKNK